MSDVENGGYAPSPDENDFEPEEYDADEQEEAYSRGPFLFVVAVIVLASFGGVVYIAYQQGLRQGQRMAPQVIVAETGPVKVAPEKPGGFEEPYQDTLVLNGDAKETPGQEKVLPPPEEPAVLPKPPQKSPKVPAGPERLPEMHDVAAKPPAPSSTVPAIETSPKAPESVAVPTTHKAPKSMEDIISSSNDVVVPPPEETPEVLIPADPVVTGALKNGSASSGKYVVQVASVPQRALAQAKRNDMAKKHGAILADLQLEIKKAELGAKGTYYRVRVGPFATRPQAVDLCETLKARGQDCFVTKP